MSGVNHLRVLHLLDTTEDYAGTEIHLTTLVKTQICQGLRAEIAVMEGGLLHRAVQAESLPFSLLPQGSYLQQLKELAEMTCDKYDVVHAHNGRTRLLAAMAVKPPIAVVATQHFISTQSENYRGLKKRAANHAHRQVNRRISHFIAISQAARDAMVERERVNPAKITIVANGIEPLDKPDAAQRIELRRELGVADGSPLIVCVARLRIEKGLHFLIDAMPAVLAAHPQTRLVIAGDGGLQNALEAQAYKLGVRSSIDFLGYRKDATRLIGAADLFVLPSPAEPFGLVLIEAMAQGIAALATRAGGPLEIIEDGVSGRLVKSSDAFDLASAMVALLSNDKKREELGHNAFQRFSERFTADRMAAATLEVYERIARARSGDR